MRNILLNNILFILKTKVQYVLNCQKKVYNYNCLNIGNIKNNFIDKEDTIWK